MIWAPGPEMLIFHKRVFRKRIFRKRVGVVVSVATATATFATALPESASATYHKGGPCEGADRHSAGDGRA